MIARLATWVSARWLGLRRRGDEAKTFAESLRQVRRISAIVGSMIDAVTYDACVTYGDERDLTVERDGIPYPGAVVLKSDDRLFVIGVSEGVNDMLDVELRHGQYAASGAQIDASSHREWSEVIGIPVAAVRAVSVRRNESDPRSVADGGGPYVQALEIKFASGETRAIVGHLPENRFRTSWFDELAVLKGGVEVIGDLDERLTAELEGRQ